MVKKNRSTLHMVYNIQQSATHMAAMTRHTDCHAREQQQPGLAQKVAARNRRHQGFANNPIRWAFTSQVFTRCGHQSEAELI